MPIDHAVHKPTLQTAPRFGHTDKLLVVDQMFSIAHGQRVVPDLPAAEARRVLRRSEFRYTPKDTSWLNMVEIEIGVLRCQSSTGASPPGVTRIRDRGWERQRKRIFDRIKWMFTTEKARTKMATHYRK